MRKGYFRPSKGYHSALMDKEFVTRVDTILQQHSGKGVEHMKIRFRLHSKHADHIDSWVSFAITSKTKKFVINLSGGYRGSFFERLSYGGRIMRMVGEETYSFPSQFFSPNNCSHLRCLELWSVSLQLPSDFQGLLNLKSLALVDVSITDENVQCMLSKCILLEFLEIAYCSMVTSIRMLRPLDQLMHLVVDICPKLQEIELNCSPTTLQYSGNMVPLIFASTSRLTNINVVFTKYQSALSYMVTGFPSTLPRLETLILYCYEREVRECPLYGPIMYAKVKFTIFCLSFLLQRTIVPEGPFKFTCLRNLRLDLVVSGQETRNVDVLDYAYLLKITPLMETMELRVSLFHCGFRIQISYTKILVVERIQTTKENSEDGYYLCCLIEQLVMLGVHSDMQ